MLSDADLRNQLQRLDRQGYRAYRNIQGAYRFPGCALYVDHVQPDPFAPPSRLRLRIDLRDGGYPPEAVATRVRRTALGDYLARRFASAIRRAGVRNLSIDAGGQEVLERTAAVITDDFCEIRLSARLPAAGRSILGREAADLLTRALPEAAMASLPWAAVDERAAWRHMWTVEDARALRQQLGDHNLVAFIADGSVLPRRSGASDLPLPEGAVQFIAPAELRVTLRVPHAGLVTGMGIPRGVTLIVGGGFHGKTTLLQAVQAGVYDHVPGDGRERVVTSVDAVKVRAEDGRSVEKVDISPFLSSLPNRADTTAFSTENASGSTSQAAGIMEALECGCSALLLDEDSCATNFMIRDELMQQLVPKELEPITPFIDRVRELRDRGVSTVLVIGGDGDYFEVADRVILMDRYHPRDVSQRASEIARSRRDSRQREVPAPFHPPVPRAPLPESLRAQDHAGRTKVRARDRDEIRFGQQEIELGTADQIVDLSQTRAIGGALLYLVKRGYVDGRRTLRDALLALEDDIDRHGLDILSSYAKGEHPGDLARPRLHEVASALNRLRSLRVRPTPDA